MLNESQPAESLRGLNQLHELRSCTNYSGTLEQWGSAPLKSN